MDAIRGSKKGTQWMCDKRGVNELDLREFYRYALK